MQANLGLVICIILMSKNVGFLNKSKQTIFSAYQIDKYLKFDWILFQTIWCM